MVMPPPPVISFDVEGLSSQMRDAIASLLYEQAGQDVTIAIATGGARGAEKNALIARAQANRQRDPFYLPTEALAKIQALAQTMFGLARDARGPVLELIGTVMLATIQSNVDGQRNPGGQPFTPLTVAYAKRKQHRFGFVVPILRATGDLIKGLRVVIDRK